MKCSFKASKTTSIDLREGSSASGADLNRGMQCRYWASPGRTILWYLDPLGWPRGTSSATSFKLVVCSHTLRVHDVLKTKASKLRETDSDSNISFLQGKVIEVTLLLWQFQTVSRQTENMNYYMYPCSHTAETANRGLWRCPLASVS